MTEASGVRPRSLARMAHLARCVTAACHQDRVDGLAAEFAFFGVLSTFPGLLGGELNGVLHRDRGPGRQVAPPG
jgi:uncharacterized BrkB/YihY/UPF0761 family membrane protein